MDTALLALRVVLSLACVLGLIWFAGRKLQGTAGVRRQRSVPLSVLGRQSLGKGAGVALVEVAGRVLLLGVGEQGVRVLTEVDVPPARAERNGELREEIDLATLPLVTDADALPDVVDPEVAAVVAVASPDGEAADGAFDRDDVDTDDGPDGDDVETAVDVPTPHAAGTARLAALAGLAAGAATQAGATQAAAHHGAQPCTAPAGALSGSILSPDTWRRAADVVQRRAAR